jgi:hypothetical protein
MKAILIIGSVLIATGSICAGLSFASMIKSEQEETAAYQKREQEQEMKHQQEMKRLDLEIEQSRQRNERNHLLLDGLKRINKR